MEKDKIESRTEQDVALAEGAMLKHGTSEAQEAWWINSAIKAAVLDALAASRSEAATECELTSTEQCAIGRAIDNLLRDGFKEDACYIPALRNLYKRHGGDPSLAKLSESGAPVAGSTERETKK